jgi:hypothetical protein
MGPHDSAGLIAVDDGRHRQHRITVREPVAHPLAIDPGIVCQADQGVIGRGK